MYRCERCGTRYGRQVPVVEDCPRCLARYGERVALVFMLFQGGGEPTGIGGTATRPTSLESAVRKRLAADSSRKTGDRGDSWPGETGGARAA
jgi:hypothetical protein